jgi:hypothetical protein
MYFVKLEIDDDLDWGWDGTLVDSVAELRKSNSDIFAREFLRRKLNHIIEYLHCFKDDTKKRATKMLLEHLDTLIFPVQVDGGKGVSSSHETYRGNWSIKTSIVDVSALKNIDEM